ncbi:MAG: nitroreductase [Syntrophaceae bacterium]|nr:nitroreductase [Syntrophaceae bacterium]
MELRTAVRERRSIRQFRREAVPRELIEEILQDARYAPSWGNTQPWEIFVVTGEALEAFRSGNRESLLKGVPMASEAPMPQEWPETLKSRYTGTGRSVLEAQSIPREDKQARLDYALRMFSLFDAPALLILCTDRSLPEGYAMLDCGLLLQTICLLARDRGLGSCILACSVGYPDLIRKLLPVREEQRIVMGAALGWPDDDSPLNRFPRERAELGEIVTWVSAS